MFCSVLYIDLIGPDTEAADDDEILCFTQYPSCKLRFGTDANDMDVSEAQVSSYVPLMARTEIYYTVSAGLIRLLVGMSSGNPLDSPEQPSCLVQSD